MNTQHPAKTPPRNKRQAAATGTCALCRATASLVKSHIMSKFLYRGIWQPNYTPRFEGYSTGKHRPGHIVERLLCRPCEDRFSEWENVARRFYDDIGKLPVHRFAPCRVGQTGSVIASENQRYAELKLFFLSVLWRAAASRDPRVAQVDLGERITDLHALVAVGDPGGEQDFPIVGTILRGTTDLSTGPFRISNRAFLSAPVPRRIDGRRAYYMLALGLQACVVTDRQGVHGPAAEHTLRSDGTWHMPVEDFQDMATTVAHLEALEHNA